MTFAILMGALTMQALPAPASVQWEELFSERDTRVAIDPASLTRTGDLARFRVRFLIGESDRRMDDHVNIAAVVVNCRQGTHAFTAADSYGADGQLLVSRAEEPTEAEFRPMTFAGAGAVRTRVCGS